MLPPVLQTPDGVNLLAGMAYRHLGQVFEQGVSQQRFRTALADALLNQEGRGGGIDFQRLSLDTYQGVFGHAWDGAGDRNPFIRAISKATRDMAVMGVPMDVPSAR